jgi:FMN reductase
MTSTSQPAGVVVVVGNPKPASRTLAAARECADAIARELGGAGVEVFDLAELGPRLLEWGDANVDGVRAAMRASTVLVVASPTYKATYTGLLKLLFDQVAADELIGVVAIPLMVGGAPNHALAVDTHLRPLLLEVGCSCPTQGLYVLEDRLPHMPEVLAEWLAKWRPALPDRARANAEGGA